MRRTISAVIAMVFSVSVMPPALHSRLGASLSAQGGAYSTTTSIFGRVRFGVYEPGTLTNPRVLAVVDVLENGTRGPYSTLYIDTQIRETDFTFDTGVTTLNIHTSYGYGGRRSMGTGGPLNVVLDVSGSGSPRNEPSLKVERLNVNIGREYDQQTGPVGRVWFADQQLLGPVGVQPATLNGPVMLLNNFFDGSPTDSPAAATWLATVPGVGAEPSRVPYDTFPVDVGLGIVGTSRADGVDAIGFRTGLQIGGAGTPWGEWRSIVGTGADISQYVTRGIYVHAPETPNRAADVEAPTFTPTPTTFDQLPVCTPANMGRLGYVIDSTTNLWGEPVRGSGRHPVGVQCNGTNWTVTSR